MSTNDLPSFVVTYPVWTRQARCYSMIDAESLSDAVELVREVTKNKQETVYREGRGMSIVGAFHYSLIPLQEPEQEPTWRRIHSCMFIGG